jgi:hypothetical protein
MLRGQLGSRIVDVSLEEEEAEMSVPKGKRNVMCRECALWMGRSKRNDHHYCRGVSGDVVHDCAGFARKPDVERSTKGA